MRSRLGDVEVSPDVFAAVMATGIVSVSALDHHYYWVSVVLAAVAVLSFVVMAALALVNQRFAFDVRDPDVVVRLFTFVAACAVLGTRFEIHPVAAWALSAIAWLAWLVLAPLMIRAVRRHPWTGLRDRAHGVWELASVATSGLAIVTVHLAVVARDRTLFAAGLTASVLGIGIYVVITSLIVWRAVSVSGDDIWRPDSWILMGGLAIATLAGDRLHRAGVAIGMPDPLSDAVRSVNIAAWVLATVWIPPLTYATVRHLRLKFTGAWWAMVFPLGMYSSATFAMAAETGWRPFQTISLVFFWIALTTWVLVAAAALRVSRSRYRG
ncbi:MAG: tellurite resistance/C4-dicarboxylate transporter family protein [Candidatus Sericytochromatia bacterium]